MIKTSIYERFDFILVEDNPLDARLINYCFEQKEVPVNYLWLNSFQAAETWLNTLSAEVSRNPVELPPFILIDGMLDNFSSLPLIRKLKEHPTLQSIPVLLYSSASSPDSIMGNMDVEIQGFYEKPHDVREYFEMLGRILNQWGKQSPD